MAWKKKNPRKRQLPWDSNEKHYALIVGQKQEDIKGEIENVETLPL